MKKKMCKWLIHLHNLVNKSNYKKIYTLEQVYKLCCK